MNDDDGLFSGVAQRLHEATGTVSWLPQPGLPRAAEWRRDWSNQPFFLARAAGVRKTGQSTLTLGMVWWFGNKHGGW